MTSSQTSIIETRTPGLTIRRPFIEVTFQQGLPQDAGVNGCRVEHVIDLAVERLRMYQAGPLACTENAEAIESLGHAQAALQARMRRRVEQGVINTMAPHLVVRTEDMHEDFSATGA